MKKLKPSAKELQFPLIHKGFEIRYAIHPEEHISMEKHFIEECGFSKKEFDRFKNHEWFRIELIASIPGDAEVLGQAHLGACCAKNAHRYVTKEEAGGYLPQLLDEAVEEAQQYAANRIEHLKGVLKNAEAIVLEDRRRPHIPSL